MGKFETDSVASSFSTVSSKQHKLIIKRLGTSLKSRPRLPHLSYDVFLLIFITVVFIASYIAISSIYHQLWTSSRTLFTVYSTLAKVDNQFRGSLQIYMERFLLFNTLLYTEAWDDRLDQAEKVSRLQISRLAYETAVTVLGTTNLIDFLLSEVKGKKQLFAQSIEAFASNKYLSEAPPELKTLILKSRFSVQDYRGTTNEVVASVQLSATTFLGNFKSRLESFESNLSNLKSWMVSKQPPFAVDKNVLTREFVDVVPTRFAALKNSLNGTLKFHRDSLDTVKEIALSSRTRSFASSLQAVLGVYFFFFSCFLLTGFALANLTHKRLFQLLGQLGHLKFEEAVVHKMVYSHRSGVLLNHRYDEPAMIEECFYFSRSKLLRLMPSKTTSTKIISTHIGLSKERRRSVSGLKVKIDFTFRSLKVMVATSLLSGLVVLFFTFTLTSQSNLLRNMLGMMSVYTDTYSKFRDVSDYYMSHSVFSIFGNFIQINRRMPESVIKEIEGSSNDPIQNLVTYLIGQRVSFKTYFGEARAASMEQALFRDLCQFLDKSKKTFREDLKVCLDNKYAGQGFLAFMEFEKETLEHIRRMVLADPQFLRESQSEFLLFPFQQYLFLPSSLNFRISHKLCFETMMEIILSAGEQQITEELARVERLNQQYYRPFSLLIIALYLLLFGSLNLWTLSADLRACDQTFYNLLPSIPMHIKIIYRELQQVHATMP